MGMLRDKEIVKVTLVVDQIGKALMSPSLRARRAENGDNHFFEP
jgi:hypothetical protein